MLWSEMPIHIIDFEGSLRSGILEYGVVTIQAKCITKVHTGLCAPIGEISGAERAQHGIDERICSDAPLFSSHWELFMELRQTGVLGAHHAVVEDGLLRSVWPYPSVVPDPFNEGKTMLEWGPWIDTCQLAREYLPSHSSYKLGDLVDATNLREKLQNAAESYCPKHRQKPHCALYDALASSLLLLEFLGAAPFAQQTLQALICSGSSSNTARKDISQMGLFDES